MGRHPLELELGMTPREYALDQENRRLRAEIEYLRRGSVEHMLSPDLVEEAELQVVRPNTMTLRRVATASCQYDPAGRGFALRAYEEQGGREKRFAYSYFLSDGAAFSALDVRNWLLPNLYGTLIRHLADSIEKEQ